MGAVTKKNQVNKVQKMAPEEMTILENIGTMISQLMSGGGNMNPVEDEVMMTGDNEEDEVKKADEDEEDEVKKENNGPTANPSTKAEDRVEDPTPNNEAAEPEVGKALNLLMNLVNKSSQPKKIQKTASPSGTDALLMNALSEMTSVMKSISDKQNQSDLAIGNILEGIGFTDKMAEQMVAKAAPTHQPVGNTDSAMIMNAFMEVLKNTAGNNNNSVYQNEASRNFDVKKSQHSDLAGSIGHLLKPSK